jgi:hypothetical protein
LSWVDSETSTFDFDFCDSYEDITVRWLMQ